MRRVMKVQVRRDVEVEREGLLARLASAYQRRELEVFEEACRPDMVVTLAGTSRLAGTYHGYGAFSEYLDAVRDVLRAADEQIRFEHDGDRMIFTHAVVISGPNHQVEMDLRVTVVFHADGRVRSFLAELEDQGLFDYVVNTSAQPSEIR
jgi:ketosteroid isomerase-like protein